MLFAILATSLGRTAFAQPAAKNLVTPQTQAAIDRGLAWLASRQREDGSFGSGGGFGRNVAVTSIGGIALLSSGSTPGRGPYGSNVNRAVDFVLSVAKPNGFLHVKEQESYGPMYGHGFATLFLAEVYGMSRRVDVRESFDVAGQQRTHRRAALSASARISLPKSDAESDAEHRCKWCF